MKGKTIKISVAVTYLAMVIVNALANILPINDITSGEVSDLYTNLFAPAGFTFSIWSVIYLLLGAYTLYQLGIFHKDNKKDKLMQKIGFYFIITSIANILWIFSWHYDFIGISLILIIVMLYYLLKINGLNKRERFTTKEKFFIKVPFSIYFGWITVATIANIIVFLVSINFGGLGISEQVWTISALLIGAVIGTTRTLKDKDIFYGIVFVWAYFGIWFKHTSPAGFANQYTGIITTVIICLGVFLLSIGYLLHGKRLIKK